METLSKKTSTPQPSTAPHTAASWNVMPRLTSAPAVTCVRIRCPAEGGENRSPRYEFLPVVGSPSEKNSANTTPPSPDSVPLIVERNVDVSPGVTAPAASSNCLIRYDRRIVCVRPGNQVSRVCARTGAGIDNFDKATVVKHGHSHSGYRLNAPDSKSQFDACRHRNCRQRQDHHRRVSPPPP